MYAGGAGHGSAAVLADAMKQQESALLGVVVVANALANVGEALCALDRHIEGLDRLDQVSIIIIIVIIIIIIIIIIIGDIGSTGISCNKDRQ